MERYAPTQFSSATSHASDIHITCGFPLQAPNWVYWTSRTSSLPPAKYSEKGPGRAQMRSTLSSPVIDVHGEQMTPASVPMTACHPRWRDNLEMYTYPNPRKIFMTSHTLSRLHPYKFSRNYSKRCLSEHLGFRRLYRCFQTFR